MYRPPVVAHYMIMNSFVRSTYSPGFCIILCLKHKQLLSSLADLGETRGPCLPKIPDILTARKEAKSLPCETFLGLRNYQNCFCGRAPLGEITALAQTFYSSISERRIMPISQSYGDTHTKYVEETVIFYTP